MTGITLDAGALIALERRDRRAASLLKRSRSESVDVVVPATVLAQVIRSPRAQARLMRLLAASTTHIGELDRVAATEVGRLLAESGTSDITDAHVVVIDDADHSFAVPKRSGRTQDSVLSELAARTAQWIGTRVQSEDGGGV